MLARLFDRLIDWLAIIAGLLLVALTLLICVDVAVRNSRLFAMPWTLDVAKYMLYGITFFGTPWVLRDGGHITIDLFVNLLRVASRATCMKIATGVGALVCLILTYYAVRIVISSYTQKVKINETFTFPEWWIFIIAPPIFFILFVIFVRKLIIGDNQPRSSDKPPGGF